MTSTNATNATTTTTDLLEHTTEYRLGHLESDRVTKAVFDAEMKRI